MKTQLTTNLFANLTCSNCGAIYSGSSISSISPCCNKALLANYHLDDYSSKELINTQDHSMWRYAPLLPIADRENIVSLTGEELQLFRLTTWLPKIIWHRF